MGLVEAGCFGLKETSQVAPIAGIAGRIVADAAAGEEVSLLGDADLDSDAERTFDMIPVVVVETSCWAHMAGKSAAARSHTEEVELAHLYLTTAESSSWPTLTL